MKKPKCSFCQGKSVVNFLSYDVFKYYRCLKCDLAFQDPLSIRVNKRLLNKKMYGNKEKISQYFKKERYFRGRAKKFLDQIRKYKNEGSLLDIGSSYGLFLDEAGRAGFDIFGVELEKEAVKFSQSKFKLNIVHSSFKNFKTKRKFDVITLIDVFEHLPNLRSAIRKVHRLLKDRGILFIQSPNIKSLMFKLTGKKWTWLLPDFHVYHFSKKSLKKILEGNGFRILKVITYDDTSEFAYNLIDVLGVKKNGLISKLVWKSLRIFFLIILQFSFIWSWLGYGGLINVTAKKN